MWERQARSLNCRRLQRSAVLSRVQSRCAATASAGLHIEPEMALSDPADCVFGGPLPAVVVGPPISVFLSRCRAFPPPWLSGGQAGGRSLFQLCA